MCSRGSARRASLYICCADARVHAALHISAASEALTHFLSHTLAMRREAVTCTKRAESASSVRKHRATSANAALTCMMRMQLLVCQHTKTEPLVILKELTGQLQPVRPTQWQTIIVQARSCRSL